MLFRSVVGMTLLGVLEILLRATIKYSIPFSLEYGTYALCLVMFAGSGWAMRSGSHIRVGLLVALLPAGGRRVADVAGTVFGLGISCYLSVALVRYVLETYERGTVSIHLSHTPLAYPQSLFALSTCVLTLALIVRLIRLLLNEAPEEARPVAAEEGI